MKSLHEIVANNELAAEKELQRARFSQGAKLATTVEWKEFKEAIFDPKAARKSAAKVRKARHDKEDV